MCQAKTLLQQTKEKLDNIIIKNFFHTALLKKAMIRILSV